MDEGSVFIRVGFVVSVDLVEVCVPQNCNVGLLAYSPLAGGSLSGKYLSSEASASGRFNLFPGYMARYNKSLARVCLLVFHL
jgi:aryl-alcohol dehydrogenase-like predicted oxidoreductase